MAEKYQKALRRNDITEAVNKLRQSLDILVKYDSGVINGIDFYGQIQDIANELESQKNR